MLLRCYYAFVLPILEYCSPAFWSAAECHVRLLERRVYSVVRLCPDQTLLSFCHRRHVAVLCLLYIARLVPNRINVCSVSFHLLLSECHTSELLLQLIHYSLKYQAVERRNLHGVSCRLKLLCGITVPTLCLTPELSMGLREQSSVGCFPEFLFQFLVAQCKCGVVKAIYK